jgi:hypothetical protein
MENSGKLPNISEDKKNELIKLASQKLGKSEGELRDILEGGKVDKIMDKMSEDQKNNINKLLNDPKKLEQTMSSPMVKKLINDYLSKKR